MFYILTNIRFMQNKKNVGKCSFGAASSMSGDAVAMTMLIPPATPLPHLLYRIHAYIVLHVCRPILLYRFIAIIHHYNYRSE